MKKFLLLFFVLLNTSHLYSQIKGIANYELIISDDKKSHNRVENYIVYFNNDKSIEFSQKTEFKNVMVSDNEIFETRVFKTNAKRAFVYKDFGKKQLIIRTGIDTKSYLIEDTLSNFKWHISKEKKRILKFNCIKATTEFRGRSYEAWFTEDIPIQNGPWKFCGLPGLIVAVKDISNSFSYQLKGIDLKAKFSAQIVELSKDVSAEKKVTHRQFISLYNKKVEDLAKMSRVVQKSADGSTFSKIISLPKLLEKY